MAGPRRTGQRPGRDAARPNRQSDLDAFLGSGEPAIEPAAVRDEVADPTDLAESLDEPRPQLEAGDVMTLAAALRSVADAVTRLAAALERSGGSTIRSAGPRCAS
jgi:hypothetical protein